MINKLVLVMKTSIHMAKTIIDNIIFIIIICVFVYSHIGTFVGHIRSSVDRWHY